MVLFGEVVTARLAGKLSVLFAVAVPHVLAQVLALAEPATAHVADERFLARVRPTVAHQVLLQQERSVANLKETRLENNYCLGTNETNDIKCVERWRKLAAGILNSEVKQLFSKML
jgi:hypothetical protein